MSVFFSTSSAGLTEVIICKSPDLEENGGFCFLEYDSHKSASMAKQRLSTAGLKFFGSRIVVDWADPEDDADAVSNVSCCSLRLNGARF